MCTHWNKPKMAHHTFIIYTYVSDLLIAQEIDSLLSHNENSTKWKLKERFSPIQPLDSRCTQRDATQSSSPSSSLTFCPSSFCVCANGISTVTHLRGFLSCHRWVLNLLSFSIAFFLPSTYVLFTDNILSKIETFSRPRQVDEWVWERL